jgi:diguanylate cyclase (GGDEF)-like protein
MSAGTMGPMPSTTPVPRTRLEIEILALQCGIALFYCVGVVTGLFSANGPYVAPAVAWIVVYHVLRSVYVLRFPVKRPIEALTPFLDVSCITAGWLVLHDLSSPLWAVYLIALVGYARRRGGISFGIIAAFVVVNVAAGRWLIAATDGQAALDANMVSVLVISVTMALLSSAVSRGWRGAEQRARELAATDPLTGIANRRTFLSELEQSSADPELAFSVLMLDLDDLKALNDQHGHMRGDEVLEKVARVLTASLREGDRIARYGGDEFVIGMPATGIHEATEVAERLRRVVEAETETTVSVGCASRRHGESVESVVYRADLLLLAAKRGGKNRIRSKNLSRTA